MKNMMIDSPRSAPQQLASMLERELPVDQSQPVKFASRREIAQRFGVSLPTVTAALKQLQRRRLVYWVPGKGIYSGGAATHRTRRLTFGLMGWFSHVGGGAGTASADTYRLHLLGDIMAAAGSANCQVTVIPHDGERPVDLDNLRRLELDGLLLKDLIDAPAEIAAIRKLGIAMLTDSIKYVDFGVGYVAYDNVAMVRDLVNIFISRGHKRIAFVGIENSTPAVNLQMRQAFFASLVDAGIIYDYKPYWQQSPFEPWRANPTHQYLRDLGTRLGETVLSLPEPPTAVFCWQTTLAEAVREAAARRGLAVPKDISILADAIDPGHTSLSTFTQPHMELAQGLLNRLIELTGNPDLRVQDTLLKTFVDQGSIVAPSR